MSENYYLLDDMERYNKKFSREEWEDKTEQETITAFREIYKALNVQIDTTTWMRIYDADKKFIYAKAQGEQLCFVRDTIGELFYENKIIKLFKNDYEKVTKYMEEAEPRVINTHYSKSVILPVYNIKSEKYGVEITIRCNFYDWKISVESKTEINADFMGLFDYTEKINPLFCEGMKEVNKCFGSFNDDKHKFTLEISDKYKVYTFMFLLVNYLKNEVMKNE